MHATQHTQHARGPVPGCRADARAPLLHIRTDLSPATSRPSSPGSHDGHGAATSPFSALRRDAAASVNPAAIRLSFAVHRDDELTPPHPSHPAAAAFQPPPAAFGPAHTLSDAWRPAAAAHDAIAAQTRRRRTPSLTLQRFASEPGPAKLPPRRVSSSSGRIPVAPPGPLMLSRPGRRSAGAVSSDSPPRPRHTRSRSAHSPHSTHSSPLKGVADFRAMLISDLSTPQDGSPAARSRGLSPHSPQRIIPGNPVNASAGPVHAAVGASSAMDEPGVPLEACRSLPAIGHADPERRRDALTHATRVVAAAGSGVALDPRRTLSIAFPTPQPSARASAEVHHVPENADSAAATVPTVSADVGGLERPGTGRSQGPSAGAGGVPYPQSEAGLDAAMMQTAGNGAAAPPANGQLKLADVAAFAVRGCASASLGANVVSTAPQPGSSGGPAGLGGTAGSAPVPIPSGATHDVGGTVFLASSPPPSTGHRPNAGTVPSSAAAAPPPAAPRPWQPPSFNRSSFGVGRLSQGDRANTLTEPKSLLIFPDTPEGHYAQITCARPSSAQSVPPCAHRTQHAQHINTLSLIAVCRSTQGCRRGTASLWHACAACLAGRSTACHLAAQRAAHRTWVL